MLSVQGWPGFPAQEARPKNLPGEDVQRTKEKLKNTTKKTKEQLRTTRKNWPDFPAQEATDGAAHL